tara:strand:+ start:101 stop:685 length:585 start_codon:yes stop_codon:yes gene_type:complete
VAVGSGLVPIVAWCITVMLLKIAKRRFLPDSRTPRKVKVDDSPSDPQAWLRSLIEQLENQYRRHNIDIFKDGNFDTYSFNKNDIAKVVLIPGNYRNLCKSLNHPVFEELEKDLEEFISQKELDTKRKEQQHALLLKELGLELGALVKNGATNKEIIDTISRAEKYMSLNPNFKIWRENEIWYVSYWNQKLRFEF